MTDKAGKKVIKFKKTGRAKPKANHEEFYMTAPTDKLDEILIAVEKRGGFRLDTQDKLPISETMSVLEAKTAIQQYLDSKVIEELKRLRNYDESFVGHGKNTFVPMYHIEDRIAELERGLE